MVLGSYPFNRVGIHVLYQELRKKNLGKKKKELGSYVSFSANVSKDKINF